MVHQGDIGRIVEAGTFRDQAHLRQDCFGFFVTLFGQKNLVRFFIQREITGGNDAFASPWIGFSLLTRQQRHHLFH